MDHMVSHCRAMAYTTKRSKRLVLCVCVFLCDVHLRWMYTVHEYRLARFCIGPTLSVNGYGGNCYHSAAHKHQWILIAFFNFGNEWQIAANHFRWGWFVFGIASACAFMKVAFEDFVYKVHRMYAYVECADELSFELFSTFPGGVRCFNGWHYFPGSKILLLCGYCVRVLKTVERSQSSLKMHIFLFILLAIKCVSSSNSMNSIRFFVFFRVYSMLFSLCCFIHVRHLSGRNDYIRGLCRIWWPGL